MEKNASHVKAELEKAIKWVEEDKRGWSLPSHERRWSKN